MLIPKDKGGPAITLPCALRTGSPRGGAGTYPALRVEDWFTEGRGLALTLPCALRTGSPRRSMSSM